jgi:hypothetical protein
MNQLNIHTLKTQKKQLMSALFVKCGVFFAFSDKQFEENKTPLSEGDKYVHFLAGGYCSKSKSEEFVKGMERIGQWFKDQINEHGLRKALIAYELGNHEAWYTYDIEQTQDCLGSDFTHDEIMEVFNEGLKRQEV